MATLNPTTTDRHVLAVSGMTCGGCARTVERILSHVPGVQRAVIDLSNGRAVVEGRVATADLVAAVEGAGYGAKPVDEAVSQGETRERRRGGCCC